MKLSFNPQSKCQIELNGQAVALSMEELATLKNSLPEASLDSPAGLPKQIFRRLFESGMLLPFNMLPEEDSSEWIEALPRTQLSPYLRFEAELSHAIGGIEPSIGFYLKPKFSSALVNLFNQIHKALTPIFLGTAVRGTPFSRLEALKLIHRLSFEWLETHPEMKQWLHWTLNESGSLTTNDLNFHELYEENPEHQIVRLTISLERKVEIFLPIADLRDVTQLMDIIRNRSSPSKHLLSESGPKKVLQAIKAVGGFVERSQVPHVYRPPSNEKIAMFATHMGHAFVIVDGGESRILIDPWIFPHSDQNEIQPLTSQQFGKVNAIFFTHHHTDHMDFGTLISLPHDVPIFVPKQNGFVLEPRNVDFFRNIGFTDVREIAHGEATRIGEDLVVEAVPFYGEGSNRMGFSGNCYLTSRRGRNILFHADASPDHEGKSILTEKILQEVVEKYGAIQVLFGTWWQQRGFVYQLGPLSLISPLINPAQWLDETESCDCSPEFLTELIRVAKSDLFISYAESGEECFLPKKARSTYVPSTSFFWESFAKIQSHIAESIQVKMVEAHPYSRVAVPLTGKSFIEKDDIAIRGLMDMRNL